MPGEARLITCVAALLGLPSTASALEIGVRVEPRLALPLSAPQTPRFNPGGQASLQGYLDLGRRGNAVALDTNAITVPAP